MKLNNLTPILAVLCAISVLGACAKKKDEVKVLPIAPVAPVMKGDYASNCVSLAGYSRMTELRFTDTTGFMKASQHSGNGCNSLDSFTEIEYTAYKLGGARADGAFDLDLTEGKYSLTPVTNSVAKQWEALGKCGIYNWEAGKTQRVNKDTPNCIANDRYNNRGLYTIVKSVGDGIQLGAANGDQDGLSIDRRFSALASEIYTRVASNTECPVLTGIYMCGQGDAFFAGRDAEVKSSSSIDHKTMINFLLRRAGSPDTDVTYFPGEAERTRPVFESGKIVMKESCQNNMLRTSEVTTASNDTRGRKVIIERALKLDPVSKNLLIDSMNQELIGDETQSLNRSRTECVLRR